MRGAERGVKRRERRWRRRGLHWGLPGSLVAHRAGPYVSVRCAVPARSACLTIEHGPVMKHGATLVATLASSIVLACAPPAPTPEDPALSRLGPALAGLESPQAERLWEEASSWDEFVSASGDQARAWQQAYQQATVREDLDARARVLPGIHRVLAVAEAGCTACVGTVPALARLADRIPGIELRITDPARVGSLLGPGAAPHSLPVAVVLDGSYRVIGCWVPDPADDARADIRAMDGVITVLEAAGRDGSRCR